MLHDRLSSRAGAAVRAGLLAVLAAASVRPASAATLIVDDNLACPGSTFATIQAAVDAAALAGDTIQVCAGTYTQDLTINKSVTLLGPQAGVNPNDANWNDTRTNAAAEATIRGAVNLSLRNDIVVDGFTVERTDANEGHFLVGSGNPTGVGASSTFDLRNLRIVGTRNAGTANWAGIHTNFLNDATLPGGDITIDRNRIQIAGSMSGSGVLINANLPGTNGQGQTTITNSYAASSPGNGFNVNRPGASATITGNRLVTDDIFTFRANNTTITGNTISDAPQAAISNTGGSTNWTASSNTILTPRAQAFLVGSTFTVDPVSDVTISGNVVTVDPALVAVAVGTVFSPFQYAYVDLRGNLLGTNVVTFNTITLGSNALNPAVVAVYGLRVRGTAPTGVGNLTVSDNTFDGNTVGGPGTATLPPSSGVFVDTDILTALLDMHVELNVIDGWVDAVSVYDTAPGAYGGLPAGATLEVLRNDLSGSSSFGIHSGPGALTLGTCNWWGANDGPGPVGPGSGVLVSTNVDFDPWLGSSDLTGQCPPDEDLDQVLDADDLCPGTPFGDAVDSNGCSDAQVDSDSDGLCDPSAPSAGPSGCTGSDNCPSVANPDQSDFDDDGIGDACDPQTEVQIDLRPRNSQNQVNTASRQLVPIAILGSSGFDPNTDVDRESVLVRGASPIPTRFDSNDVDGDGFADLTLYFRARDFAPPTPAECADPNAIILLTGNFHPSGLPFEGTDSVSWQGCR